MRIIAIALALRWLAARTDHPFMTRIARLADRAFAVGSGLWPLPLIVRAELLLLAALLVRDGGLSVTRLSLGVAMLVAAAGLVPALLRPSRASGLVGCVGVLLGGFVLVPVDLGGPFPSSPGGLLGVPAGAALRLVNGALLGPVLLQLTTVFPAPRPLRRGALAAAYGVPVALLAAATVVPSPYGRLVVGTLIVATAGLAGVALARLAGSARTDSGARIVLLGALLAQLPLLLRPLSALVAVSPPPYSLALLAQLLLPLALAAAVLRYDLFGIDAMIRRALVYTTATLGLLALYFGLSASGAILIAGLIPEARGLSAVVALLAAAAAFAPLQKRARGLLDRLLYPERLRFRPALAAAQARLSHLVDDATVREVLTETLPQQLGAAWGELRMAPATEVVPHGDADRAWSARLEVGGQVLGRAWIGPRPSGPPYDREELGQLDALGQQAALALANANLVASLRELTQELGARVSERTSQLLARERALAAAAERQRLARELHDSVTQSLFSLSLGARALSRQTVGILPEVAAALAEQEATAQEALGEMRALLLQLRAPEERPEESAQADLVAALRAVCALLLRRDGLAVSLAAPDVLAAPDALVAELASLARAGLHNVAIHSGVLAAELTVAIAARELQLTISDAGRGFDPEAVPPGRLGLHGMRERVCGLGGRLEVVSAEGRGTRLLVRVPWEGAAQRTENFT